jgi:uncharacterized membrane protein HdeD (DUF308 family)
MVPMERVLGVHWWSLALRGVAAILLGILAFVVPGLTLGSLVLLFGIYALVDGVLEVAGAVRGMVHRKPWGALLIEGLVSIGVGIIAFVWPSTTVLALLWLIAIWSIVTGVFEVSAAIRLRKQIDGEWLLAITGIVSILFGVLLIAAPGPGALALVWWLGAYVLVFGVLLIVLAFRVRAWTHGIDRGPYHFGPPLART